MKLPFSLFTVSGQSMEPTLKPGQKIISFNWTYFWNPPKKRDLVAIEVGDKMMVKRIGNIKGDQVFVVGDNPKMSTDSRKFGWVNKNKVIGIIIWVT